MEHRQAAHHAAVAPIHGGTAKASWLTRDAQGRLALFIARAIHALRSYSQVQPSHHEVGSFERVDSTSLRDGGFHASNSMGLEGGPSMIFNDTMPAYCHQIDRPASLRR